MFLSNPQTLAIVLSVLIVTSTGCSSLRLSEPVALTPTVVAPPETALPFQVEEPATYQADFVAIAAGSETRSHFARMEGKWRVDTFAGEKPSRSIIGGEKYVYVDHAAKQYSEAPVDGPDPQPTFVADLTTSLLNQRRPATYEKLEADGTFERYRVSIDGASASSTIVFDPAIRMIVRHEFEGGFAFEMRNFTLEVGDEVFAIPSGYRKISWTVFKQL